MILVQALEEFPYNNEFVGRNFNAGEVIQLVLRDRNGRWLPQRMIEMVMVHELAHCKQMNHSKAFWKVRDAYAVELRALWARGFTGQGLWGRGRELDTGAVQTSEADHIDVPENLCGGTYARKGGKRKRGAKEKPTLTYAERKQFGAGGQALGADEDTKVKLENGIEKKGKPRVAGSARGRDLRAAAALARFDTTKKGEATVKEEPMSDSDTEDEFIEGDQNGAAIDVDGKSMLDDKGRALVKVCEDDDDDKDGDAKRELIEIQGFSASRKGSNGLPVSTKVSRNPRQSKQTTKSAPSTAKTKPHTISAQGASSSVISSTELSTRNHELSRPAPGRPRSSSSSLSLICPICSLENDAGALTCMACAHVLQKDFVVDSWACKSSTCKGSKYINAGDAGVCGVCGSARQR